MFPRNPLVFGQKAAHLLRVSAFVFARSAGLRHAVGKATQIPVRSLCGSLCTPSPFLKPGPVWVGPFSGGKAGAGSDLYRQAFAETCCAREIAFSRQINPLHLADITSAHGGRAQCVFLPFFSSSPWQALLQAAPNRVVAMASRPARCKPRAAVPSPVRFSGLRLPMPWMKTWLPVQHLVRLPVARPAAFRAWRPATDLTETAAAAAFAARRTAFCLPITKAIRAFRPDGLFRFAYDCAGRPACG